MRWVLRPSGEMRIVGLKRFGVVGRSKQSAPPNLSGSQGQPLHVAAWKGLLRMMAHIRNFSRQVAPIPDGRVCGRSQPQSWGSCDMRSARES